MRSPDISHLVFPGEAPPVAFSAVSYARYRSLYDDICKGEQIACDLLNQRRLVVLLAQDNPNLVEDWRMLSPQPNPYRKDN